MLFDELNSIGALIRRSLGEEIVKFELSLDSFSISWTSLELMLLKIGSKTLMRVTVKFPSTDAFCSSFTRTVMR